MPKNSAKALINGGLVFLLGFAMVWYIWWLAIFSAAGIILTLILRGSDDDTHYVVPAAEVERIENRRYRELAAAGSSAADDPASLQPLPAV